MLHHPPAADWRGLVPLKRHARHAAEAVIASGAEPGERAVYVVIEGTVRLSLATPEGREQVLAYVPAGSVFGEQAALGRTRLCPDLVAVADEDCVVGEISPSDLTAALARRPALIQDLMRITGEKTSLFLAAASRAAFGSARAQVTSVLAALGHRGDHVAITQERLARLCGTTRVTVAAQLHQLEDEGVIRLQRNRIEIKDAGRLGRLAA